MFQRGGVATAATTLAISQDHGQVSIALPDGTKLVLAKDNCQLQIGSNPLDLQRIADLSAALAVSKLEYAKLSQELAAVQREKQQLQDELKKRPGAGFKPMTVATSPTAAPPAEDAVPVVVLTSPMHVKREIAKASDVTEDNVIKHLAAGFDPNRLVGSDSPQNAKYGAASLLFWAAYGGQDKTIELLIKAGAKPDLKSKTGETALEVCIRKQRSEECVQLLKAAPVPKTTTTTTGFVRGSAPGLTPSGFVRSAAPTVVPAVVRPTTSYSSSYVRPTGTFLPPSNGSAQPPSPSTPLTPSTPVVGGGSVVTTPTTPLAEPAAVVIESPVVAAAMAAAFTATTVETAVEQEPAATDAAAASTETVAAAPAVEEAPNRPLTFMEKRRLSTSAPPIITGSLDVSALRSGLRPAPARVIAPKPAPAPEPAPAPAPVEGAPPVRVNKLADRMKMFERKT